MWPLLDAFYIDETETKHRKLAKISWTPGPLDCRHRSKNPSVMLEGRGQTYKGSTVWEHSCPPLPFRHSFFIHSKATLAPSMLACGHIPRTDELSYFWGISALSEDFWLNPDTVCLIPQPIVVCLKPSKVWGQMILVLPIAWENPPGIWQRSLKLSRLGLKKAHVFTRIKQTTTTKPGRPKILFSGRAGSVVWDCGFDPHHHRKKRKC